MKNPHPVDNTWSGSMNKERILLSVPNTNKKFKRKSREPKRLFTDPEAERRTTYSVDVSDVESVDGTQMETGNISRLPPLQRQLMMSQEAAGGTPGIMSGLIEGNVCPSKSGAIDMRTGTNDPAISSKPCQLPPSPFPNPEISLWPTSISQPLSNRLKLGLRSSFSLTTPAVSSHSRSPRQQTFSVETSLLGHSPAPPVHRASQAPHCQDYLEPQIQSQESPRKQAAASADGAGHHPEVKAIQQTRRLLANARERTRVHTISAAFEALRKQVPCYSYGQKLSKLAILRIACNYILSLAQLAEMDYSSDHSSLSFAQCVEQCTRTLQAEGRSKKRKE